MAIGRELLFWLGEFWFEFKFYISNKRFSDVRLIEKQFKINQGYSIDWRNIQTLNEKLQVIKLTDRDPLHSELSDKIAMRRYIEVNFGIEYLPTLVFTTGDYNRIYPGNLPDFPLIIKTNHDSGTYEIIRDKQKVNWEKLREKLRKSLRRNYYWQEREWQYKNIKPQIIVEKLLLDEKGRIPNDYKLNFFHGELEFIYVAVDREGINKRVILDKNWNVLPFTWSKYYKNQELDSKVLIPPPLSFESMIQAGKKIAQLYKYVRVDFYDVNGKWYLGEITQCQGGGYDQFRPFTWDYYWGEKVNL